MKKLLIAAFMLSVSYLLQAQEIGVQLYSFRNQFKSDVKGTIEMIHKMGITEIEGGGTYGMQPKDFKQLLDDNKLKTIAVGADFAELEKGNLQPIIDNAKFFGAAYVVCYWVPHNDSFTIQDAKQAIEVFNKAGKAFKAAGLSFCYHAHGYEFLPYNTGTIFDYMMQHLDAQYVNIEMDVFWIKQPGQNPVTLLNKYPGRFPLMHLKDRKPGTPNSMNGQADEESNVILGAGDVGIADIMKVAKKAGVKHYFIEDESSHSVEQMPESLKFLATLH